MWHKGRSLQDIKRDILSLIWSVKTVWRWYANVKYKDPVRHHCQTSQSPHFHSDINGPVWRGLEGGLGSVFTVCYRFNDRPSAAISGVGLLQPPHLKLIQLNLLQPASCGSSRIARRSNVSLAILNTLKDLQPSTVVTIPRMIRIWITNSEEL